MPPAGRDEPLAVGYLFLLQRLLEHLRYRTDQAYADAESGSAGDWPCTRPVFMLENSGRFSIT
jgi:hypothetical protein